MWSQNPEFLYLNCEEVNFNPKFSRGELKIEVLLSIRWRGELKIEVLLSTKISSPLLFNQIYPPVLLFLIYQQLYLFQINLDFSKWQLDLLKKKEDPLPWSCKFNCIYFEEAFVKKKLLKLNISSQSLVKLMTGNILLL